MKTKEFIDAINNSEEPIYSLCCLDDYIENMPKLIKEGTDLDSHRWYSTAINIYKCDDGFVGVFGAYQSFSEMQDWDDIGVSCKAYEYKEIQSVAYIRK